MEGKITEFHVAATSVNLLSKIQNCLAEKNLAGGVAAAINGMPGALVNAAMLSFYDGEDMHNFSGRVNGRVVCGVIRDADKIKDGDVVWRLGNFPSRLRGLPQADQPGQSLLRVHALGQ